MGAVLRPLAWLWLHLSRRCWRQSHGISNDPDQSLTVLATERIDTRKQAERNRLIVLLSFKSGLRAKEIASLKWSMVMNADGNVGDHIHPTNDDSKGRSGRVIAMHKEVRKRLMQIKERDGVGG